MLRTKRRIVLIILLLALSACGLFPESIFTLSDDSRLPKWFAPYAGTSRAQIAVEMSYYSGRTATFVMKRRDGSIIFKMSGRLRGDFPIYLGPSSVDPVKRYPMYEVVTVNGISEAIEHRAMEPVFFVSDDPAVLSQLGLAQTASQLPQSRQ